MLAFLFWGDLMNNFDLYMKKMGFMKYEASPTDQEKKILKC
ncbi:hypothetical protein RV09_GL001827 [Enterococcus moraviensis]|nr:hypothetical protein RV09_GL001827 [Enterococcus moraviensis]